MAGRRGKSSGGMQQSLFSFGGQSQTLPEAGAASDPSGSDVRPESGASAMLELASLPPVEPVEAVPAGREHRSEEAPAPPGAAAGPDAAASVADRTWEPLPPISAAFQVGLFGSAAPSGPPFGRGTSGSTGVPGQNAWQGVRSEGGPPGSDGATTRPRGRAREQLVLPDWNDLPPAPPNVFFGTSSWTYPGWKGLIYSRSYRESGDTVAMLEEYARCPLFGCVGADSSFYRPPSRSTLESYQAVLPTGFKVLGKAYDRITIQRFSNDPKWGEQAGDDNPDFLNAARATDEVVGPWLECLRDKAGPLMFEFQTMYGAQRPSPERWAAMLEAFFSELPREGQYAVELRNPELFGRPYLQALKRCGVSHVFNSWTRMPSIGEQLRQPECLTAPFLVSRVLLRPGRTYDQAVDKFAPYASVQEPQPEVRQDVVRMIEQGLREHQKIYVLVNNRLEGNSPGTIQAIRHMLAERGLVRDWQGESSG